ncbi:hypothetical protein EHO98_15535 [Leptospira stimsonii]|uniref:Transposase IS200-like domain-containing protein n=1 Tax=Leptospira stimsonii TaxID=2202203 RepID=A0ABY2NES0_9LEPT|nr:transposase [Leptospira stimsonii]TGK15336.1 hypothetical protein EHO98_15535 [Leptospira stimsonii]TGM22830.1 hypothetical protein EHQ90_00030 [Leptospira stimsonii]
MIFETRKKIPWLDPRLMIQIRNLFREKCEELNLKTYLINGTKHQANFLLSLPPTIGVATVVRHLKVDLSRILGKSKFWSEGDSIYSVRDEDFLSIFRLIRNRADRSEAHNVDRELKSA